MSSTQTVVCASAELAEGSSVVIEHAGACVLVARSGGQVFAVENRCTHQDAELHGGRIRRGHIACPLHGVMFNLETGAPSGQLTKQPLRTFAVHETDGAIYLS